MPQAALIGGPSIEVPRWLSYGPPQLGIADGRGDRNRYSLGDLVLHREDVGKIPVVALGPDVVAGLRFDELRGDADPISGLAHAAFEHITYAELVTDLLNVDDTALVGKGRVARDDEQG